MQVGETNSNIVSYSRSSRIVHLLIYFILIYREEVARELKSALSHIKLAQSGVYVQASTLGSLEALLEFLRTSKIPVSKPS